MCCTDLQASGPPSPKLNPIGLWETEIRRIIPPLYKGCWSKNVVFTSRYGVDVISAVIHLSREALLISPLYLSKRRLASGGRISIIWKMQGMKLTEIRKHWYRGSFRIWIPTMLLTGPVAEQGTLTHFESMSNKLV